MTNYAALSKVEEAQRLRELGYSLRFIAKTTGLNRETVRVYVGKISQIDAMYAYHAIRKGLNLPSISIEKIGPRRRKRRFVHTCSPTEKVAGSEEVDPIPKDMSRPAVGKYQFDRRKILSAEEEQELWFAWRNAGDISARDLIVRCHLKYVMTIAKMMKRSDSSLDVLVAEGNYGLLRAVNKFEPERGLRFVTYAAYWIRAAISNYKQLSRTIINKPLVSNSILFKIRRERARALNAVGNDSEAITRFVSEKVGLPVSKIHDVLQRLDCHDVSLDSKVFSDSTLTMVDALVAPTPTPDERLEWRGKMRMEKDDISNALSVLQPREKFIVEQRFMIDDPPSLAELGVKLGVTRERVRQLEERTVKKLRKSLAHLNQVSGIRHRQEREERPLP